MGDVNSRESPNNSNSSTPQNTAKKKDDGLIIIDSEKEKGSNSNSSTPVRRKRLYKDELGKEFESESTKEVSSTSTFKFRNGEQITTNHVGNSVASISTSSNPLPISNSISSTTSNSNGSENHNASTEVTGSSPVPTVFVDPNTQEEYLMHKLRGKKDTIQGLALKYGVQATDIKKINKLWTSEDIFSRKEILIPTTMEDFLRHQSTLPAAQTAQPPKFEQRVDLIKKFMEISHCDEMIATYFLESKNYNFTKALGMYFAEQENKTLDIDEIRKKHDEKEKQAELQRERAVVIQAVKPGFVELDDDLGIYTEEEAQARQQLGAATILPTHVISGPAHLTHVKKRVQEQLEEAEDRMFDL